MNEQTFFDRLMRIDHLPEVREGPDNNSDLAELCPDHGAHVFTTMCGVTRCFYCNKVVG